MHSVDLRMHADQEIKISGDEVNVHDLRAITINGEGLIVDYVLHNKFEREDDRDVWDN